MKNEEKPVARSDPYRSIFALHPAATWVVDSTTGRILDANDAAVRRLGYSLEEFRTMSLSDLGDWNAGSGLRRHGEAGRAEPLTGIPSRLRTRSGRWTDVELTIYPVPDYPVPDAANPVRVVQAADPPIRVEKGGIGERYRLAAQASHDALYDWDARTDLVWWSEQFFQYFGHTPAEVGDELGSWKSLVHPDDRERVWSGVCRVLEERGETWQDEYRLRRGDGSYASVHDRSRFIYDAAGGLVRCVGLVTDVTSRREAEAALWRSQEMFRASVENLFDPLGIAEAVRDDSGRIVDFRVTYVNSAAEQSNGMPRDEQLGRKLGEMLPALREAGVIDRFVRVVETGEPLMLQNVWFRSPCAGGDHIERAFDIRAARLGDGLMTTWRDVTHQVHAREALQRSEERFRELAENIREIFWISDPGFTRLIYVSPSFEEIWGYPRERFYDDPRAFLGAVHAQDRARVEAALGGMQHGDFDEEYRIIRPDGEVRWTRVRGFPVRDAAGEIQRIAGIAEDTTQQKRSEHRIQKALAEKEVLLREIHHRVKNNLQIISSLMRLQSRTVAVRELQEVFREHQSRIQSMALLHELLYRSDNLGCIELADYLQRLGRHLCQLFGVDGWIRFSVSGSQLVNLDTAVACGLISNELISNSIRHAFPDRRAGSVSVELEPHPEERSFRLTIRDDGIGMRAGTQPPGGATLGLRLVTMLAEQLGSTARQRLDAGTVTLLDIPLADHRELVS